MKKLFKSALAILLCVTLLPVSAMAASVDYTINGNNSSCDFYNIIEKNDYNLAPGAVESEIILNDATGNNRNVVHVIEVDPTNDNISVMPTFKNISNDVDYSDVSNWGSQEMTKQVAHIENDLGKNVVGAMNVCLSWDFTHPYGLLLYEGEVLFDSRESCDYCASGKGHPGGGYLVIYKDGRAEMRDSLDPLTGEEWMAQTICFSYLVKDGKNLYAKEEHTSDKAPRSVLGVKADGTLVIMMNDGRMSPYSAGFNSHEMAEAMIALGCVDAINCDGGGSSTFITEREGSGELSVKSRFSDGSERQTLTGIAVISKAVADGKFDHAAIDTKNALVTPGSTVEFEATGADSAGGPAEIPTNIEWQLEDPSMGTISDGIFVSNGKTGTVVVQMLYNGKVVGADSVEVVVPDSLSFVQNNITAPYTKTVKLDLVAKSGYSEVVLKNSDIKFTLSDGKLGIINGNSFTATDDISVTSGDVTATLVYDESISASAKITLGKGSEIVYDFETGSESVANWSLGYKSPYTPENYYFKDEFSVVSVEEGGKVKNGNYALKITADGDSITCMNWCQTRFNGLGIDVTDAVSISFWMYIPEGSHGYEWDIGSAIPVVLGHEFKYGTGWQYFTVPISEIGSNVTSVDRFTLYHSDTNNTDDGYYHYERPNYYADVTYYIDDITVNYSSAVEDNQAPIISDAQISYEGIDTAVAMNGQIINSNVVAVTAKAKDNMDMDNYTGIDASSVVVYVDGVEVNAKCSDSGIITTGDMTLANGTHIFRFETSDNNGNTGYIEKSVVINGTSKQNTIKYELADPTLENVLVDSVVWMNLKATEIEKVSKVTTVLDLDNNSKWELDHMELPVGFEASYTVDNESNDVTFTIERTGNNSETGEAVLASIPVRVWSPSFDLNSEDAKRYRLISVMSYVQMGLLTETDGNEILFASETYTVSTEYNSTRLTSAVDKPAPHVHTAVALEGKAETCTECGYTGRTFCEGCNSVVEWGETVRPAGHEYLVDGENIVCDCGEAITSTGLITINENTYYLISGKIKTGWHMISDAWYYLGEDGIGYSGKVNFRLGSKTVPYEFESTGKLKEGVWLKVEEGYRYYYGPDHYHSEWATINGKKYYFSDERVRVTGIVTIVGAQKNDPKCYVFADDGKLIKEMDDYTGLAINPSNGKLYYFESGIATAAGLVCKDGDYYYINTSKTAVVSCTYPVSSSKTNGLLPAGEYEFGADGKMILKNGLIIDADGEIRYYENGAAIYIGLVQDKAGNYYYINSRKKAVKSCSYSITSSKTNGLLPAGTYEFDAEGKLIFKSGLVKDADGEIRYYKDGAAIYVGLVQDEAGNYYYINSKKKAVKSCSYSIMPSKTNGLLPAGTYEFDTEGKLIFKKGLVKDADGEIRYYEDGVTIYAGLVQDEAGNYYYINSRKKAVKSCSYSISSSKTNGLLPAGTYAFDAEGKLIFKNGLVKDGDGEIRYYEDGVAIYVGLVQDEVGNYYYINSKKKAVKSCSYNITKEKTNGLLPAGTYEFDAEGRIIIE